MPQSAESRAYRQLWHDMNRELWRAAADGTAPRNLIRAELWRRVDHTRILEKSASIRMMRRHTPPSAVYKACEWLVQDGMRSKDGLSMPTESALDAENAARPLIWPMSYPGVDTDAPLPDAEQPQTPSDHFDRFVHAFVFASQAAINVGLDPHHFIFEFDLSRNRWIVEGTNDTPFKRICVNFLYMTAGPKIWNAIFEAIVHRHAPSRRIAERYVQSVDAQQILAIYSDISPLMVHDVYDLSAMFDELNQEYFNNALPKPILAWTPRANYRTLGTYNFHWDIICISRIMNDRRVPEIAVRFVLYHEMLHIKHGLHNQGGRAVSHTPQFRADEMKFKGWEEATRIHQQLRDLVK